MFSSAVSIGSRLKNWKTNPMCWRRSIVMSRSLSEPSTCPAIHTLPLVGLSSAASRCISVDFPDPDGPMTATSSPGLHVDRDAAQRVDRGLALSVAPDEVRRADNCSVLTHGSQVTENRETALSGISLTRTLRRQRPRTAG